MFGVVMMTMNSSAEPDYIRGDNLFSTRTHHNHVILDIDLVGQDNDTDTDSIDIYSLSTDDDDVPPLEEQ